MHTEEYMSKDEADRPVLDEDIEVTEEMISAGLEIMSFEPLVDAQTVITAGFRAMFRASKTLTVRT